MTKFGETDGYTANKFLKKIENYLGRRIDTIVLNTKKPEKAVLNKYKDENSSPVIDDLPKKTNIFSILRADLIAEGVLARHDIDKLTKLLKKEIF